MSLYSLPAFTITPTSSHTYSVNLDDAWCIGSVPNGGYITSLFLCLATTHFNTTHPRLKQPNPITLNLQFLRRTSEGPATFTVKDVKLGARTSIIQVALSQVEKGKIREEVVGFITNSNFETEDGVTLDTEFKLPESLSPLPPPADLDRLLKTGEDDNWIETEYTTYPKFRKAAQHGMFYLPKKGQPQKPIVDEWMRFRPHGKPSGWTNESLGFLVDLFPQIVEAWYPDTELPPDPKQAGEMPIARFWYPTLSLNLDIKKALPKDGSRTFLFQRVRAKVIRNGRLDLEVIVGDEKGEVIAVAQHSALVMDVSRNVKRDGKKKSKL